MYLVEAAHDENGNLSYGQPGDQTGDEVRRRKMGDDERFSYILRYPDKKIAESMAKDAEECAENDNIGYAQQGKDNYSSRYGLYFAMQGKSFKAIKIPCNADCTALIADLAIHNGLKVSRFMWSGNELEVMTAAGFEKIPFDLEKCEVGDVLWRQGHSAIVVSGRVPVDYFKGILRASSNLEKWNSGQGLLTREAPFLEVRDLGFKPSLIVAQEDGEVISVTQWMREQKEGFLYCANYANDASAGIAVGTGQGYFNPDAEVLKIPVRFPGADYIVRIYK